MTTTIVAKINNTPGEILERKLQFTVRLETPFMEPMEALLSEETVVLGTVYLSLKKYLGLLKNGMEMAASYQVLFETDPGALEYLLKHAHIQGRQVTLEIGIDLDKLDGDDRLLNVVARVTNPASPDHPDVIILRQMIVNAYDFPMDVDFWGSLCKEWEDRCKLHNLPAIAFDKNIKQLQFVKEKALVPA
jgi:hypothetical protein